MRDNSPNRKAFGEKNLIRLSACQMEPRFGQKDYNIKKSLEMISIASSKGANLIVLPELCNTGYVFNSREEVLQLGEPVPGGETIGAWTDIAKEKEVYIIAGITELDGERAFNSAAVIGPNGYMGKYRKVHLWDKEKLFFEPGDLGLPIFNLPFGRIGVMICYDGWHPEVPRILTLQEADVIVDPTAWVVVPGIITPEKALSPYIHMGHANMNNIFIVCADRIGVERDTTFLGNSCIAGPSGFLAGPASFNKEEVLVTEANVSAARNKDWTMLANPIADRRTDLYHRNLGYNPQAKRTMMYNFQNKVAIVTGAGSGMGRMVALRLAEEGAKVALNGRRKEKLEKVASEIGRDVLVVPGDVGFKEDVKRMVSETVRVFGKVDILVNAAGIDRLDTVVDTSEEDWDELFRTNTKGVFLCCQAVAPYMIKQGSGKIINIASISGKLPTPLMAAYCASKAAVILFTQSLALELAKHKINVNAVCPGGTAETEMREYVDRRYQELGVPVPDWTPPIGRMVKPLDIAEAVLFLASSESDMITGQAIDVDGGVCFS